MSKKKFSTRKPLSPKNSQGREDVRKTLVSFAKQEYHEKHPLELRILSMNPKVTFKRGTILPHFMIKARGQIAFIMYLDYGDQIRIYAYSHSGMSLGASSFPKEPEYLKELQGVGKTFYKLPKVSANHAFDEDSILLLEQVTKIRNILNQNYGLKLRENPPISADIAQKGHESWKQAHQSPRYGIWYLPDSTSTHPKIRCDRDLFFSDWGNVIIIRELLLYYFFQKDYSLSSNIAEETAFYVFLLGLQIQLSLESDNPTISDSKEIQVVSIWHLQRAISKKYQQWIQQSSSLKNQSQFSTTKDLFEIYFSFRTNSQDPIQINLFFGCLILFQMKYKQKLKQLSNCFEVLTKNKWGHLQKNMELFQKIWIDREFVEFLIFNTQLFRNYHLSEEIHTKIDSKSQIIQIIYLNLIFRNFQYLSWIDNLEMAEFTENHLKKWKSTEADIIEENKYPSLRNLRVFWQEWSTFWNAHPRFHPQLEFIIGQSILSQLNLSLYSFSDEIAWREGNSKKKKKLIPEKTRLYSEILPYLIESYPENSKEEYFELVLDYEGDFVCWNPQLIAKTGQERFEKIHFMGHSSTKVFEKKLSVKFRLDSPIRTNKLTILLEFFPSNNPNDQDSKPFYLPILQF